MAMSVLRSLLLVGQAVASHKKGLCIPPGNTFHCGDLETVSNASWWYNWHTQPNHGLGPDHCTCPQTGGPVPHSAVLTPAANPGGDCGPEPSRPAFVPMVWGYHEDDRPWHDDINDPVAQKYPVILGFYITYCRTGILKVH